MSTAEVPGGIPSFSCCDQFRLQRPDATRQAAPMALDGLVFPRFGAHPDKLVLLPGGGVALSRTIRPPFGDVGYHTQEDVRGESGEFSDKTPSDLCLRCALVVHS